MADPTIASTYTSHSAVHNALHSIVNPLEAEARWRRFRNCGCSSCVTERTGAARG